MLSKARLYRGFGALTLGGILGAVVSFVEFVIIGGLTPVIMLISHDHHFKWWFDVGSKRAYYLHTKRCYRKPVTGNL